MARCCAPRLQSSVPHLLGASAWKHAPCWSERGTLRAVRVHPTYGARYAPARLDTPRDRQRRLGTYRHHRHLRDPRLHAEFGTTFNSIRSDVEEWRTTSESLG